MRVNFKSIFLVSFTIIAVISCKLYYDYSINNKIFKEFYNENVRTVYFESGLDDKYKILIYSDVDDTYRCQIIKNKNRLINNDCFKIGEYALEEVSNNDKKYYYDLSILESKVVYNFSKNPRYKINVLVTGAVYDKNIKELLINGEKTNIVELGDYSVFYYYGIFEQTYNPYDFQPVISLTY